jgi:hypothetical protein
MFKFHDNNRKIDQSNLENIKRSIKINNLLAFRPIMVNEKLEILDGQHRFLVAKELGLDIFYQVNEESKDEDIILMNANQKRWTLEDFINFHATKGSEAHRQLQKFSEKNGISLSCTVKIFCSNSESYKQLKTGGIKGIQKEKIDAAQMWVNMAKEVIETIGRYSCEPMTPYRSDRCLRALMAISRLDGYDHEEMKDKIAKVFDRVRPCRTEKDWFKMFLDVYNYGKRAYKLGKEQQED